MLLRFVVGFMLSLCVASGVQATQVCGWLVETNQPDNVHDFALWLRADGKMEMPESIFSDTPTPVLAKFTFQRSVPESETKAPQTLARKQCVAAK